MAFVPHQRVRLSGGDCYATVLAVAKDQILIRLDSDGSTTWVAADYLRAHKPTDRPCEWCLQSAMKKR